MPETDPDEITTPFQESPADSHVKGFWFINRAFSEKGGPSELWVTFRSTTSKKTGKVTPETTYKYYSMDHAALRQTFEKMTIASHPGEIIWSDLIRPGVSYSGPL